MPHAKRLVSEVRRAVPDGPSPGGARHLTYELIPQADDVFERLDRLGDHVKVMNVDADATGIRVTVRVPDGKRDALEKVFEDYATKLTKKRKFANQPLVDSIDRIRAAAIEDLWTSHRAFPSPGTEQWWEVWLDDDDGDVADRFRGEARDAGVQVGDSTLRFPDRSVVLARVDAERWGSLPRLVAMIAELRHVPEATGPYVALRPVDQAEWVADLVDRMGEPPAGDAPAVCILDSGVDRGHPLLSRLLAERDCQAWRTAWETSDTDPDKHGSLMAGLAAYGCLAEQLASSSPQQVRHVLESVKILPPPDQKKNDVELYGRVTQESVGRAEVRAPRRKRVICLAVTSEEGLGGLPTSWSAAVDQMIAGGPVFNDPKLMVIAAGNLRDETAAYGGHYPLDGDPAFGAEDPCQSWNAISVGAFTEKTRIDDDDHRDYTAIAPAGDVSPSSRTSWAWPDAVHKAWPLKPDVVFEGGNWAQTPDGFVSNPDDLGLLSTALGEDGELLAIHRDTSAATALAAKMAIEIWIAYPQLRPETVRALMVHSARWTDAMKQRIPDTTSPKTAIQKRLRYYGYGVPGLKRAIDSKRDAATLVYEGSMKPYVKDGSNNPKLNRMHLHRLPWPREKLLSLKDTPIEMRVTLSYYVEPGPGRRGFKSRYRYASHGLRFDVRRPAESDASFERRINGAVPKLAGASHTEGDPGWVVGTNGRGHGSLHVDWWRGEAADLAMCGELAVFPVGGWWKTRIKEGRWDSEARYSLVVSLTSPEADVDLYTPIAVAAGQVVKVS